MTLFVLIGSIPYAEYELIECNHRLRLWSCMWSGAFCRSRQGWPITHRNIRHSDRSWETGTRERQGVFTASCRKLWQGMTKLGRFYLVHLQKI